jgi:hypothetical protein
LKALAANRAVLVKFSVSMMVKGRSAQEAKQEENEKKGPFLPHNFLSARLTASVDHIFLSLCFAQTRRISWQSRHSSKT